MHVPVRFDVTKNLEKFFVFLCALYKAMVVQNGAVCVARRGWHKTVMVVPSALLLCGAVN